MMDMQAALGIHQLRRIDQNWERRKKIWSFYYSSLSELPLTLPVDAEVTSRHGYHLFTVLIEEGGVGVTRDEFIQAMNAYGIGTGVHYRSISEHPYYQERFEWRPEQWPEAFDIGRQTVSLPLSPSLSEQELSRIIEAITRSVAW